MRLRVVEPERCDRCRFYFKRQTQDNGCCRRRAPTVTSTQYNTLLFESHPYVGADWWCGEFERAPASQPDGPEAA